MTLTTIYPNGNSIVEVPASQSIAISNYGGGIASIYYLLKNANQPDVFKFQQTLENSGVILGAFATGKTIKIESGNSTVVFDIGLSPDTGIGNADTLNGLASASAATASTITARDSNADITARRFISGLATGTSPLSVTSTTVNTNLNADLLDNQHGTYYARDSLAAHLAGTETFTGQKFFGDADTYFGTNSSGNTKLNFYDANSAAYRSITWHNVDNTFYVEDNSNTDRLLFHAGNTALQYIAQGAQAAKTTDATLTAAEIATRIITVNNGAAGTTTLTLPLASDMDTQFSTLANDFRIEFSVINISVVAAEDATIATNTGWTLVGSMVIEANDDARARSSALFRARKTATATWTLYRIS